MSQTHALLALLGIVLMATALAALVYRAKGRLALLEPSSAIMIIVYMAGLGLMYLQAVAR